MGNRVQSMPFGTSTGYMPLSGGASCVPPPTVHCRSNVGLYMNNVKVNNLTVAEKLTFPVNPVPYILISSDSYLLTLTDLEKAQIFFVNIASTITLPRCSFPDSTLVVTIVNISTSPVTILPLHGTDKLWTLSSQYDNISLIAAAETWIVRT